MLMSKHKGLWVGVYFIFLQEVTLWVGLGSKLGQLDGAEWALAGFEVCCS